MSEIGMHPRVSRRHPEIEDADVIAAMRHMLDYSQRDTGEWVAVGVDGRNRLLEMVYQYIEHRDAFFVYHAMTPPSRKTLIELRLERR